MLRTFALLLALCVAAFGQAHQHDKMPAAPVANGQFNPSVAADQRGGFYLAYVQRTGTASDVMVRHSADGKTFTAPVRVNDVAGDAAVRNENPPKVIVAPNHDVYVCWANERERWKGNIRFARSTDGGKTFSKALTLNSDAAAPPVGHAFQSLAVDTQGRIFIAWIDERRKTKADRGGEIWMSVSTNRGQSFGRDYRILSDVCECCRTTLVVDAHGTLFLSYRTVPHAGPMLRDIVVARSQNSGKTFTPVSVSADGWEVNGCPVAGPSLNLDAAGNPVVVWFMGDEAKPGLYFSRSTDGGKTYAPRQTLDAAQHIGKHVHLAGGIGKQLFVAWDDADAKTFSVWGAFDGQASVQQKSANYTGIAYPVAAVNGKVVLIAGLNLAAREIATFLEEPTAASAKQEKPK